MKQLNNHEELAMDVHLLSIRRVANEIDELCAAVNESGDTWLLEDVEPLVKQIVGWVNIIRRECAFGKKDDIIDLSI